MNISILQKNYLIVPIAILVYIALKYVLDMTSNKKEDKDTYIKSSVIVGVISFAIVYIHKLVPPIEEIITTPPPF